MSNIFVQNKVNFLPCDLPLILVVLLIRDINLQKKNLYHCAGFGQFKWTFSVRVYFKSFQALSYLSAQQVDVLFRQTG